MKIRIHRETIWTVRLLGYRIEISKETRDMIPEAELQRYRDNTDQ